MPDMTNYSDDDLKGTADVAFNATVVSVGSAPAYLSGDASAYQTVSINVTELRSGAGLQVGDAIDLAVPVVASSRQVVRGPNGAFGLDASLFRPGAPFAAWASQVNGVWTALTVDIEPTGSPNIA
jgi:hypothetical protein